MLNTLFLSLDEAALEEDRIEGLLDYISKADHLSGEQDQFSFVLAFFFFFPSKLWIAFIFTRQ